MQNRTLSRAFKSWIANAASIKERRIRIQRVVARIARGTLVRSFEYWIGHVDERKRMRNLVRKLLGRHRHRSEASAFSMWRQWKLDMDSLAATSSMKSRFELLRRRHLKSVTSIPKPIVVRLFHVWHKAVLFEKSHSRHIFHSTLRRRITTKRSVFAAWREYAFKRKRSTLKLRGHILSAIRVRLVKAITRWKLVAHVSRVELEVARHREAQQKRLVLRMLKSTVSRAFHGWRDAHAERRRQRQILSR